MRSKGLRDQPVKDLVPWFEARGEQPQQRIEKERGERDQQRPENDLAYPAYGTMSPSSGSLTRLLEGSCSRDLEAGQLLTLSGSDR